MSNIDKSISSLIKSDKSELSKNINDEESKNDIKVSVRRNLKRKFNEISGEEVELVEERDFIP